MFLLVLDIDELMSSSSSDELTSSNDAGDSGNELNNDSDDGSSNESELPYSLARYVELSLIKYPGTHELYLVLNKQDENQDHIEIFRKDFCDCECVTKLRFIHFFLGLLCYL